MSLNPSKNIYLCWRVTLASGKLHRRNPDSGSESESSRYKIHLFMSHLVQSEKPYAIIQTGITIDSKTNWMCLICCCCIPSQLKYKFMQMAQTQTKNQKAERYNQPYVNMQIVLIHPVQQVQGNLSSLCVSKICYMRKFLHLFDHKNFHDKSFFLQKKSLFFSFCYEKF